MEEKYEVDLEEGRMDGRQSAETRKSKTKYQVKGR